MVSTGIRLIIFFAGKDGEAVCSEQKQDLEKVWLRSLAPYCKIQAQSEERRKTTRAFKYDLNQIPYDTLEVVNRFKGLDLVDRVPEELRMEVCNIVQELLTKIVPKKKKCKKAKQLSEEDLQVPEKRREAKGKGERERHAH